MVDESSLFNEGIRKSIVSQLVGNVDREELPNVLSIASPRKRVDAFCGLVRESARKAALVMIEGCPHVYVSDDGLYHRFSWNMFADALYEAMVEMGFKDGDFGKLDSIVKFVIRAISPKNVCIDSSVVVMRNGVYDTNTHELMPFDPKYISVSGVNYDYVPMTYSTQWAMFLNEVLPDKSHRALLQQAMALPYIDRSKIKVEYLTILKGTGANGKSVVFNTALKLYGKDSVSTFSISDLINVKREQNIATCNGMRMNYCSEIRTSEIGEGNADAFKALVSGEPIMARRLYQEPFLAKNIPILFANANKLPKISDPSYSIQRRIIIIPFDVHIPLERQDASLSRYIADEIHGVFNWVMDGLRFLQENDYKVLIPEDVVNEVSDYVNDINTINKWLRVRGFKPEPPSRDSKMEIFKITDLYKIYIDWCNMCFEEPFGKKMFIRGLIDEGFERRHTRSGNDVVVYRTMTDDDVYAIALQEAIERQRDYGFSNVDLMMEDDGVIKVKGISNAERYLGLVADSLLYYYRSGKIDDTFEVVGGMPIFHIQDLQAKLASLGYYCEIVDGNTNLYRKRAFERNVRTKNFNEEMEVRGLPFYKSGDRKEYREREERGYIRVSNKWEYTEDSAKEARDNFDRYTRSKSAGHIRINGIYNPNTKY